MAANDARPIPRKNVAYRLTFPIFKTDGTLVTGAAGLDSEVSKDAGAFADCTAEATEIGSSGFYYLDLSSTEMNADCVAVVVKTSTTDAIPPAFVLYPQESGDIRVSDESGGALATAADLATVDTEVGVIDGIVDAILADTGTTGVVVNAAGLQSDAVDEIVAGILASVVESQGSITLAQAMRLSLAVLAGRTTISGGTYEVSTPNGVAPRATFTLDVNKQRTAVTLTP